MGNLAVLLAIFLLIIFGITTIALQFSGVQTSIVQRLTSSISSTLGYPISVKKVNVKWFDTVSLEGVEIQDLQKRQMIEVERLDVNLNVQAIFQNRNQEIRLDEVILYKPDVKLIKNEQTGDLNFDEFIARINEVTAGGDTTHSDNHIPFWISKASLSKGKFQYEDPREPYHRESTFFDHNHFTLEDVSANIEDFLLVGDTIAFQVNKLATIDQQTHLKIHRLDTRFLFCQKKMELADLYAQIGNSVLNDYISFNYNKAGDFSWFNSRVRMKAHFSNSTIQSEDLGLFHEYLLTLRETWNLRGDFDGTVEDFVLANANINFGTKSVLAGDIGFKGLPSFFSSTMNIRLRETILHSTDMVQYYPGASLHSLLEKFQTFTLNGQYEGTVEEFDLSGSIKTSIGELHPNLHFIVGDKFTSSYKGTLLTKDLDLGILLENQELWQTIDFEGQIEGSGFDLLTASVNLDAHVAQLGINHYDYQSIDLFGNLQHSYFNGRVQVSDSSLSLNLNGEFDLRNEYNRFDITGNISTAKLQKLGFSDAPLFFQTGIVAQLEGNYLDDLVGEIKLNQFVLDRDDLDRRLHLDSIKISSEVRDHQRQFKVTSELADLRLSGNFELSQTFRDLRRLIKEYTSYFSQNEQERKLYYQNRDATSDSLQPYLITYELRVQNMNPFWRFMDPLVYVAESSFASGVFRVGSNAFMSIEASSDSLFYGQNKFYAIRSTINTSKTTSSDNVLASGYIESRRQKLNIISATEHLKVEAYWDKDHIDFRGGLDQSDSKNNVNVAGEMNFTKEGFDLHFKESKLEVLDEKWSLKPKNRIEFKNNLIEFRDFSLVSGKQYLTVDGKYSDTGIQDILLSAGFFKLSTFNTILNTKLDGILDGSLRINNTLRFDQLKSNFDIEGLSINDFELGNFRGTSEWDDISQAFYLNADLTKNLKNTFRLSGTYKPNVSQEALKLKAAFAETELQVVESFVGGVFSNISGTVKGDISISGSIMKPRIAGKLLINEGHLKVDYLQTFLQVSDTIRITPAGILAENMLITDSEGNSAHLSGGFTHKDFRDFTMNLEATLQNFKILNTTDKDNDLFYGTAYVTGNTRMTGPLNDILINANVTSNKGTRIYIPFDGASTVDKQDYIQFVSQLIKEDSSSAKASITSLPTHIRMNFNFNITPDAYCEIQLDRQAGDIIKAYGSGLLNMNVDTEGDFVMNGNYNIERGDYTFTLQNALNKKFDIKSGSRISWSGDPFEAMVNINAGYTQMSSLASALANYNLSSVDAQGRDPLARRYPVEVLITLSGRLLTPQVGYSLEIKESPASGNYRSAVAAFENRLKNDEQEMSRQVSSLLLFNQLLSPSDMLMSSEGFLGNSVSELIANQISSWASAVDENLEVGLTGLSLDQNALTNLQLRFSYRFLNDRFRITRDGRFTYGTAQYDAASLMGEWTLEYWLNAKGSLRGKVYNRNIQNPLILSNTVTTGGVSMQFTHSFNHLGFLQSKSRLTPTGFLPDTSSLFQNSIIKTDSIR